MQAGAMSECDCQMSLAQADAAYEDYIGVLLDEAQAEEVLHLSAVDLFGPCPVELLQGLEHGQPCGLCAAMDTAFVAGGGFSFVTPLLTQ